jgi:hypothetical protein
MRYPQARIGASALFLTCSVAGALLTAGPASAASRGFKVDNRSAHALQLQGVKAVPSYTCISFTNCVPTHHPIDFEGRPGDGTVLQPGKTDTWELKYGFSVFGGVQYAANLSYKVQGTDATVDYQIYTYSTTNESSCKVTPTTAGRCTAEGVKLSFLKP